MKGSWGLCAHGECRRGVPKDHQDVQPVDSCTEGPGVIPSLSGCIPTMGGSPPPLQAACLTQGFPSLLIRDPQAISLPLIPPSSNTSCVPQQEKCSLDRMGSMLLVQLEIFKVFHELLQDKGSDSLAWAAELVRPLARFWGSSSCPHIGQGLLPKCPLPLLQG